MTSKSRPLPTQANEVIRMHRLAHPNNSGRHRDSIWIFPLQQHRIAKSFSCPSSPSPRPKTPLIAWLRTNSTGLFTNLFLSYLENATYVVLTRRRATRIYRKPRGHYVWHGTDVRRFRSEHHLPITCKTLCKWPVVPLAPGSDLAWRAVK